MIVRRDGKSNIHYGSCFDEAILSDLRSKNIDIGLINPPYSQEDHNELEFVKKLLSVLTPHGVAVAVVPINCALGTTCRDVRERLFASHTLEAVFSMPTEIFNPAASAPPCVMVWTAKVPHPTSCNGGRQSELGMDGELHQGVALFRCVVESGEIW